MYTSPVMFHKTLKLPVMKLCKTLGWITSILRAVKKNLPLMSTVSMSAPYQLSASHSSVVIMKTWPKEMAEMQASMLSSLENLLHSYSWILFCATYIFYIAVAFPITQSLSFQSFSFPGSYTCRIHIYIYFQQHTHNTEENLMFQTDFILIIFRKHAYAGF